MTHPSRRFVLRAAGAAGLALMPLGRNALAVRATSDDPTAPWTDAPAAAAHPDLRILALAWAVLAPSPHNRQPWIAELPAADPDLVVLRCDLERRLPVTDPLDRQITIGLGAFAELFRMAAAAQGRSVMVSPFPEGEPAPRLDNRPVATLRLGPPGTAATDPLFRHAALRRSNKRPYDMDKPVTLDALQAIGAAVAAPVMFGGTVEPARVATLRAIVWRAWQIEATTQTAHRESVNLMRLGSVAVAADPDGIAISGPGLDEQVAAGRLTREAMLPGNPGYDMMLDRYASMLAATPAYLWLTTSGRGRVAQLNAGRDWLRVNLAATALGLAVHPVSQALQEFPEMREPSAEMQAALAPNGDQVQMLARLGFAAPPPPTPRWPAASRSRAA